MNEANKPAYPVVGYHKVACDFDWTCGVSKREYFAAKAMQVFLNRADSISVSNHLISARSYAMADAMLAETERYNAMLALVEKVAGLHPAGTNTITTQKLRNEAQWILDQG